MDSLAWLRNWKLPLIACILALGAIDCSAEELTLKLPPTSIEKWYKPASKRHVWLHNMFSMRRELQAIREYADAGDKDLTRKWADRLVMHYRKIAEMVPEWEDELELEWTDRLEAAAATGDLENVKLSAKKMARSCTTCHREYRALAVALYRVPDYSKLMVKRGSSGKEIGFRDAMNELVTYINRVKIAVTDGRNDAALKAVSDLKHGLHDMGNSCGSCHRGPEPRERILGEQTQKLMDELAQAIRDDDRKAAGKNLGGVAVMACAWCHGVHRTAYDIKRLITR
ncbi:MAG: cytochrome c [Gammaproteobacteria bacterium]|nr:cytochrome c [Gammaproteobacteria bacterium]